MSPQPDEILDATSAFDLAQFLRGLTLEPMVNTKSTPLVHEPLACSRMMPLEIKSGGNRQLKTVRVMDWLERETTSFFRKMMLQLDDPSTGLKFRRLPLSTQTSAEDLYETVGYNPYEVSNRGEVVYLVEQGPLRTAQALVHEFEDDLEDWTFYSPRRDGTLHNQGIQPIFWTSLDSSKALEYVRCIVIPMAPWEFTPKDFEDFTYMSDFIDGHKSMDEQGGCTQWSNAAKLWAYLHDLCILHDCRHFVVTTYEQWSFGAFSTYFSTSMVSRVKSWNNKPHSVQELLTYWLLTACRFQDTFVLNEDPPESSVDCAIRPHTQGADKTDGCAGWEPLGEHSTQSFFQPRVDQEVPWDIIYRTQIKEKARAQLPTPPEKWNSWQKRITRAEKENSSAPKVTDKSTRTILPGPRRTLGHPIPCYSMDVDRANGRFRPELVAFRSFPLPRT